MLNSFSWNGTSSNFFETEDCRVIISKCPTIGRPARKYDRYDVPGRNGTIIVPQDAYDNYTQSYEIFLYTSDKGRMLNALSEKVSDWLYSADGKYAELVDDHEDGYFRLAYFVGPLNVENLLTMFGRATITFSCRPERFLFAGNEAVTPTLSSGWASIVNPTNTIARPKLSIDVSDYSRVKIEQLYGDITSSWVYVKQTGATELVVDSESHSWKTSVPYAGKSVTGTGFPLFATGETFIKVSEVNSSNADTGNYPSWSYVPRWWAL